MSHLITTGDHLVTSRIGYSHHGIYVGDGKVVHYSGFADERNTGPVEEVTLAEFSAGHDYFIKKHKNPKFSINEIAYRARSRIGEDLYCVFSNNCEHFCEWCINNDHDSQQITNGTSAASPCLGTIAGLTARGVVAASGPVAGLSSAGMTGGLASVGTLGGAVSGGVGTAVGLGASVSGIAILGAVPAIAAASLVNDTVLKDNPSHSEDERDSRAIGRTASYVGAAAGTAGTIGAISALGTTAGLSGAGITSGLAALGGGSVAAGGLGMAGGIVVAAAAPVAAAVVVGYGVYKLVKWFKD